MTLTSGQILQSRYRVISLLAQGGFGAVYQGWDDNLGKPVAIKENLDTSPEAQRQFQQEARILSNLSHPNLPRVTDHFFIPGFGQYLVMDFIEGEDLQAMLDRTRHPLPEAHALAWIDQVCAALEYLHEQTPPIIHRDIKPANIKITPQGKAVLVDFGISKIYDSQLKTTLGARAVTPPYSPPEQYGQGSTDPRSDLYALGATLYTLLTGQEPPESVDRVSNGLQLTPPRQLRPSLSPQIDTAIVRACEVNRTQRYQSARELRQALQNRWPVPVSPVAYTTTQAVPLARRSPKMKKLLLGMVVIIIGIAIIVPIAVVSMLNKPATLSASLPTALPVATSTALPTATAARVTSTLHPPFLPSSTPDEPFFAELGPIGYSVQGRPLTVYRLGTGPIKRALIGGIHGGYEWNTVDLMTKTLEYLRANPDVVPPAVTLYILPNANPDGYAAGTDALHARVNANGVDLNSNWDYQWAMTATHDTRLVSAGTAPFSEPETVAMRDFIVDQQIEAMVFYHSPLTAVFQGAGITTSKTVELAKLLAKATGYRYLPEGVAGQITTGDSIDWLTVQGFTAIEVELSTHQNLDWEQNLRGVGAFLNWGLPEAPTASPIISSPIFHVVVAGDTLPGIALKYGVSLEDLYKANGLNSRSLLSIDQRLIIPVESPTPTAMPKVRGQPIHVVVAGESLSSIATAYGVSVDVLLKANGSNSDFIIFVGQELIIPTP